MKNVLKFLILLGLTATVAEAKIKVDPLQAASFTFSKGYQKAKMLGGNTQLFFVAREAGSCKGIKYAAGFNWSDKKGATRTIPMPAGKPLTIYTLAKINIDGGYKRVIENRCARTVTFTPSVGANYEVLQTIDLATSCDVQIVDLSSNTPVEVKQSEGPICGGYI